jgi:hypothetical protein
MLNRVHESSMEQALFEVEKTEFLMEQSSGKFTGRGTKEEPAFVIVCRLSSII